MDICFVGDTSFTGVFGESVLKGKEIFSNELCSLFCKQDFVVCNLEGPATNKANFLRPDVRIVNPKGSVEYLVHRNFNIFNLANNHLFDCGIEGFFDTRSAIETKNVNYFGAGESIVEASSIKYFSKDNVRIGLVGISHSEGLIADLQRPGVFCDRDFKTLHEKIQQAKKNADWIILNYHGGEEFTTIPTPKRRKLFHKYIKLDIDMLIAHHSHVFQGFERVENKTIFYSLGNFIFDTEKQRNIDLTSKSAILKLKLSKNKYDFQFVPIAIDSSNGSVRTAHKDFLVHILKKSDFKHYYVKWLEDANRTFYETKIKHSFKKTTENSPTNGVKHKIGRIFELLFSFRTYLTLFSLIKAPNRRPIFFGVIQYQILRLLKVIR